MTDPIELPWFVPSPPQRLRWCETPGNDGRIYRFLIWRGWLHTPSGCYVGRCTRCWRGHRERERLRRRIG